MVEDWAERGRRGRGWKEEEEGEGEGTREMLGMHIGFLRIEADSEWWVQEKKRGRLGALEREGEREECSWLDSTGCGFRYIYIGPKTNRNKEMVMRRYKDGEIVSQQRNQ